MKTKPNRFRQNTLCGVHVGKAVTMPLPKAKENKCKYIEICLHCTREECKGNCDLIGR